MSIDIVNTGKGDTVIYANPTAGYDPQCELAAKHLKIGEVYEVEKVDIHDWHTNIHLVGYPHGFNSCLFDNAKENDNEH